MSLDPIKDRRLDQLLDAVSEDWLSTPNDALDGDTPRERLQHWHDEGCLYCRSSVVWLMEDMEDAASDAVHDASDPHCCKHIPGITKRDSTCLECKTKKLGGYR